MSYYLYLFFGSEEDTTIPLVLEYHGSVPVAHYVMVLEYGHTIDSMWQLDYCQCFKLFLRYGHNVIFVRTRVLLEYRWYLLAVHTLSQSVLLLLLSFQVLGRNSTRLRTYVRTCVRTYVRTCT
jgi:hypothetical protein